MCKALEAVPLFAILAGRKLFVQCMKEQIFSQGLDLMLYGMGTVFVFLTLLVFALRLLELVVRAFPQQPVVEPARPRTTPKAIRPTAEIDASHRAAIEKAMQLHLKS